MQETMDSSRKWSGYVCPDCRFVFRVPRDHDGQGVVCPSCRRMLKIPAAGDRPLPLVASLRVVPVEEPVILPQAHKQGRRRRSKKSSHHAAHEWDSSSGMARRMLSLHVEKRQMFWMLVGGVTLFALIVAGVLIANRSKSVTAPAAGALASNKTSAGQHSSAAARADVAILAEAEPLTRKFLTATRIEDLLPLVRHPEVAVARMRDFYPKGAVDPPGLAEFNTSSAVVREGAFFFINVRTRSFDEKSIAYADSKDGLKIDWEIWVGWSAMTWDEFLKTKPTTARVFRLRLNPIDYYNFAFSDDRKWQAYRIVSPDGAHSIYGYVERGSAVCAKLSHPSEDRTEIQQVPSILSLKFPGKAISANQVLIEDLVAEGWVLETEPPP